MGNELERALSALHFLDAGCDRETWHKTGRGAIAAGVPLEQIDAWSATGANYAGTRDVHAAFRTIKPDGGTGAGTLFRLARDAGWTDNSTGPQRQAPAPTRPGDPPREPAPGMSAADVWNRCEAATKSHRYITQKRAAGVPLDGLRVVPAGDGLIIQGEHMAEALVVPIIRADGFQVKQAVGVVVNLVLGRGGQPHQQTVKVIKDGAVLLVHRAVRLVDDDEVKVPDTKAALAVGCVVYQAHHRRIGTHKHPAIGAFLAHQIDR